MGLASSLAETALNLAREKRPQGRHYLSDGAEVRSEALGVLGSYSALIWQLIIRRVGKLNNFLHRIDE